MIVFTKVHKVVAGIVIVFMLGAVLDRIVLVGLRGKVSGLEKQSKLKEKALQEALAVLKDKDKIEQDFRRFNGYLIGDPNDRDIVARFMKEFEKITKESGVSVVSFNPDSQCSISGEYKRCRADVRLEGNLEQLFKFLQSATKSSLLICFDRLTVVPKDEKASVLKIDAVASMVIP